MGGADIQSELAKGSAVLWIGYAAYRLVVNKQVEAIAIPHDTKTVRSARSCKDRRGGGPVLYHSRAFRIPVQAYSPVSIAGYLETVTAGAGFLVDADNNAY